MTILAFILIAYTVVMLLIHVSTGKILEAWDGGSGPAALWIQRRFPPQRALRVEALYWALSLVAWSIWPSFGWKIAVVVFAAIHLGIWAAGELHAIRLKSDEALTAKSHKVHRTIIAFDLVEAALLVAIAWLSVLYLQRTR